MEGATIKMDGGVYEKIAIITVCIVCKLIEIHTYGMLRRKKSLCFLFVNRLTWKAQLYPNKKVECLAGVLPMVLQVKLQKRPAQ